MILITGCNSKAGKKLLEKFHQNGEKIRIIDFYKPENIPEDVEFIQSDLLNLKSLMQACKDVDTIYHFLDIRSKYNRSKKYMKKVIIKGTENLLFAANRSDVKQFIYISSFAVYGNVKKQPINPNIKLKPATPYGRYKMKAENICNIYAKKYSKKISITIARPALILGKNMENSTVLMSLYMSLGVENENRIYTTKNGDTRFQLLHTDDFVNALLAIYKSEKVNGKIYNIGASSIPSQKELIDQIKEKFDLNFIEKNISKNKLLWYSFLSKFMLMKFFTKEHSFFLSKNMVMNCELTKIELKWKPEKSNFDIISELVDWYLKEKI